MMRKLQVVFFIVMCITSVINASVFRSAWKVRHPIQVEAIRGTGILQQSFSPSATFRKQVGSSPAIPTVALTREFSKNCELRDLILNMKLQCDIVMLPVLHHVTRLDNKTILSELIDEIATADVVVLTSPQAASTLVKIWHLITSKRHLKIAAVGKKTSSVLDQHGINVNFTPSEESAACLSRELPRVSKLFIPF